MKLRLGRQQFAFDLERFVSVRDGPNVRQSYDAAWVDFEQYPWRASAIGAAAFYVSSCAARWQEVPAQPPQ